MLNHLKWNPSYVKRKSGYFDKARHPELEGYDQILNMGNMRLLSHGDELGMAHFRLTSGQLPANQSVPEPILRAQGS